MDTYKEMGYINKEDMQASHQSFLNDLNKTIEVDSFKTYVERAEEKGWNMWKEDVIDSTKASEIARAIGFNELESYYIPQATLSTRASQWDRDNSFKIGDNQHGGI